MDTKKLESIAVSLITHKLLTFGLLIARPEFDTRAADLLVFKSMEDNAKMGRIQCKYRSVMNSKTASITILSRYVSDNLFVFINIKDKSDRTDLLYCFFDDDIRNWKVNPSGNYVLRINRSNFEKQLASFLLSNEKVERITTVLTQSDASEEFSILGIPQKTGAGSEIIFQDKVQMIKLEAGLYGFHPIVRNNSTGVEVIGTMCPGDPSDFRYDSDSDTWIST